MLDIIGYSSRMRIHELSLEGIAVHKAGHWDGVSPGPLLFSPFISSSFIPTPPPQLTNRQKHFPVKWVYTPTNHPTDHQILSGDGGASIPSLSECSITWQPADTWTTVGVCWRLTPGQCAPIFSFSWHHDKLYCSTSRDIYDCQVA